MRGLTRCRVDPELGYFHGVGGHDDEVQGHASSPSAVVTSAGAEALVQTVENIIVVLSLALRGRRKSR